MVTGICAGESGVSRSFHRTSAAARRSFPSMENCSTGAGFAEYGAAMRFSDGFVAFRTGLSSGLAVLLVALPALCQDAPMFRGNLRHTGVYEAAGAPAFSRVKWTFHAQGQIISSPAIVGDTDLCRFDRGNVLRDRPCIWRPAVEVRCEEPHRFIGRCRGRPGLLRRLRRLFLCARRSHRPAALEVRDRRRAPVRGQ